MNFHNDFFSFLLKLPKDTKVELIKSFKGKPYTQRGSGYKNAELIYKYLKEHYYPEPTDDVDFSVKDIIEFINSVVNPFSNEDIKRSYFAERIPRQDDDEPKQLEMLRDSIEIRIKELQKEHFNDQIW